MDSVDQIKQEKLIIYITLPLSSIIILTNLIIIMGIVCNRQLHDTPNYFFLSLLVADLCTGLALPFIPRMGLHRSLHFRSCLLVHIFPNFLFLSFLFNLVMVHYERYLCIVHPLHYSQFWVHRCFPVALLAVWIPPLLYASLPAFGWNNWTENCHNLSLNTNTSHTKVLNDILSEDEPAVYGILLPGIFSILVMTSRVLWITRKHLHDICTLNRAVERTEASEHEHRLNLRYLKCVAAVSLTFLVCWVPYIVYLHVSVVLLQGDFRKSSSLNIILSCTGIGSMAIIPVILSLANRQYTEPVCNLLMKIRTQCTSRVRDPRDRP
ncbi:G-protein coupled bile acid receptor 1 [Bagarius yarrelli]|uniref:G-protein coupled bile acid receptor 1 n=1 Tax=Bagarius yarrelli TaxID=175774 RepID=A0A556VUY5_BAGYA|nr:G-protein coupled bile acid receptor 1 [Bagarius yarrelli]